MKAIYYAMAVLFGMGEFVFADSPPSLTPAPVLSATLQIEVLSSLKKPVPGAEVYFYSLTTPGGETVSPCGDYEGIEAEALSESLFEKDLTPGRYRVEVTAEGWQGELIKEVKLEAGGSKKLEVSLEPGSVIAGRVVDETGGPLTGAKVSYWGFGESLPWFFSASRETLTDADGRFRLGSLKEGIYNLRFALPGYVETSLKDVATGQEALEVNLKKGFAIKGKLVGDTGSLGEEVRLEVKKSKWGSSSKKVALDAENNFAISDLEEESYDIRLKDGDYLSEWVRNVRAVAPEAASPLTLAVHKGARLSGKVINSGTGLPLEGVQIKLTPAESKRGEYKSSDKEGEYNFQALAAGDYELEARLRFDSYSEYRIRKAVSLSAGEELSGFDLKIDPGRAVSFSGMVVDEGGKPVAEAEIKIHCRRTDKKRFRSDFQENAVSDASGYFAFSTFLDGEMEIKLSAEKEGFAPARSEKFLLTAAQNSLEGLVLKLNAGTTLRVEVVDDEGASVPRAKVKLERDWSAAGESVGYLRTRKKLADARGLCRFKLLPPDLYRIEVEKSGYAPVEEKLELKEGEVEKTIRLELEEGRRLRVLVKNSAGDPVEGAGVSARPARQGFMVYTSGADSKQETDSRGLCLIEDLPPESLLVGVEADGYVPVRRHRVEDDEDEVEIVLEGGGSIRGRLLGPGGKTVEEMEVRPRRQRKDPFDFSSEIFTGRRKVNLGKGRFKIGDLKAGIYTVRIKAPGLALKEIEDIEVKLGEETDVGKIKLEEESTISGEVLKSEDDSPLSGVWVRLKGPGMGSFSISDRTGNEGRFTLENIPPGTYTLVAREKDRREKEVEGILIAAGEDKEMAAIRLEEQTAAEKEEKEKERNLIPSLGIRVGEMGTSRDFTGLSVGEVLPGSAAEAAGLKPGDSIVKVNGKGLWEDPSTFLKGIMGKPGTKIKLSVKRKDSQKEEEVDLTIGEWDYEKVLKAMGEQ